MIYLRKGQKLSDNPSMVVYDPTGYYNDGDSVICASAGMPDEPACRYEAKYIAYGGFVYSISDPDELLEQIKKIDPTTLFGKDSKQVAVDKVVDDIVPQKSVDPTTPTEEVTPVATTTPQVTTPEPNQVSTTTPEIITPTNQSTTTPAFTDTSTTTPTFTDTSTTTPTFGGTSTTTPEIVFPNDNVSTTTPSFLDTPVLGETSTTTPPEVLFSEQNIENIATTTIENTPIEAVLPTPELPPVETVTSTTTTI